MNLSLLRSLPLLENTLTILVMTNRHVYMTRMQPPSAINMPGRLFDDAPQFSLIVIGVVREGSDEKWGSLSRKGNIATLVRIVGRD